ncbi:MAG: hypothetical protein U9O97_04280 [Elusimicrobiota bacterium]|nr:hypothetical protein [Elusimicrobiota bacterium]
MRKDQLDNVLKTLDAMKELELQMSYLYRECSKADAGREDFWARISEQEVGHAAYIDKMIGIIGDKAQLFSAGRNFNITAVKLVIDGIKSDIEKVKSGKIKGNQLLFMASDLEQSLLEKEFTEIVKSENSQYTELADRIMEETFMHRTLLEREIRDSAVKR